MTFTSQSLKIKWPELTESPIPPSDVVGVRSVTGWLKQVSNNSTHIFAMPTLSFQ